MQIKPNRSYRSRQGAVWTCHQELPNGMVKLTRTDENQEVFLVVTKEGRVNTDKERENANDIVEEVEGITPVPTAAEAIYSHKRWNEMIEEMFEEVRHLAKAKGGEYSGDTDRLLNFRRNARGFGIPMELVWGIYAAKHWDAVQQYVQDLVNKKERERLEPINGRIKDLIVYLLLLEAMLEERQS